MERYATELQDNELEPHARRNRLLAITVSALCYVSILLALYASSFLTG